ncbi:MAG: hypothetical protein ABI647_19105, partial [Gemmatimonadota bacterium]
ASESGGPAISRGNRATTMACLNCAEVSWPSWPNIRRGVDGLLTLDDRYAADAVRALYRAAPGETALEAGNSGAATTGGLMAIMREDSLRAARDHLGLGPTSVVLCLCTEGAIDQAEFHRVIGA